MGLNRSCAFAIGLSLGSLVSPVAQILAAKYAGHHWLEVASKEFA